jgi:hypothetical protein
VCLPCEVSRVDQVVQSVQAESLGVLVTLRQVFDPPAWRGEAKKFCAGDVETPSLCREAPY